MHRILQGVESTDLLSSGQTILVQSFAPPFPLQSYSSVRTQTGSGTMFGLKTRPGGEGISYGVLLEHWQIASHHFGCSLFIRTSVLNKLSI
jgi:hypothetical protein